MKIVFTSLAILTSICLIGQSASGFVWVPNTAFVALSGCDAGYLVKDCDNKGTIHKTKSYTINLQESLNIDNNDKKPSDKKNDKSTKPAKKLSTDKKKPVKKEKTTKKLGDDLKKKFDQIKKKSKPVTKSNTQKTKHDTAKNSINNIR